MRYHAPFGSPDPNAPYVDRNSPVNTGSKVPAAALNWMQNEIVDVISKSGLVPDDVLQLAGAIQSQRMNYAADSGTADALVVNLTPAPASLVAGMPVRVQKGASANATTTPTLKVNTQPMKPIVSASGSALSIGDLAASAFLDVLYDGANFRLMTVGAKQQGIRNVIILYAPTTTWTVPPNVYQIVVEGWAAGGGGGGGNGSSQSGGGGAGGAYFMKILNVIPGTILTISIGTSAAAAPVGSSGTAGGATSVTYGAITMTAPGGGGGQSGAIGALGGSPGNATGGDEVITGGQGGNYFSGSVGGRGGEGPRGGSGSGAASNGNIPGGGGGGGGPTGPGARGADGYVRITY